MSTFRITSGLLAGLDVKGELPVDEHGYRRVVLGALNVNNSVGDLYTGRNAIDMFGSNSCIVRRIEGGGQYIEVDHPSRLPGQTMNDFYNRIFDIEMKNVCGHISKIELDEDFGRNNPEYGNPNIILVIGWVKPFGPYKEMLEDAFNNPLMNLAFSVRGITNDMELPSGLVEREFTHISTWDYVPEPGIKYATRRNAPGLESYRNKPVVTVDNSEILDMDVLTEVLEEKSNNMALESNVKAYYSDIAKAVTSKKKPVVKKHSLYDLVSR